MTKQLRFVMGDSNYDILIKYSKRRKSIELRLLPNDKNIYLTVPEGVSDDKILSIIAERQKSIAKQFEIIENRHIVKRTFENGSKHLFLGKEITLKIIKDKDIFFSFENNILEIKSPKIEETIIEKLLYIWYDKQARTEIPKIIAPVLSNFILTYKKTPKHIEYKRVKSYWGVCRNGGTIGLNIELIRAREESIKMIFTHELCHLIQPNHSKKFYSLLETIFPNWKQEIDFLKHNIHLR